MQHKYYPNNKRIKLQEKKYTFHIKIMPYFLDKKNPLTMAEE